MTEISFNFLNENSQLLLRQESHKKSHNYVSDVEWTGDEAQALISPSTAAIGYPLCIPFPFEALTNSTFITQSTILL